MIEAQQARDEAHESHVREHRIERECPDEALEKRTARTDDALDVLLGGLVSEHDEFEERTHLAESGDQLKQVRRAFGVDEDQGKVGIVERARDG